MMGGGGGRVGGTPKMKKAAKHGKSRPNAKNGPNIIAKEKINEGIRNEKKNIKHTTPKGIASRVHSDKNLLE